MALQFENIVTLTHVRMLWVRVTTNDAFQTFGTVA